MNINDRTPIKINGRLYPLWSKFVFDKARFIGRKLQDLGTPGSLFDESGETTITDIRLTANGDESAMFHVDGDGWGCACDVLYLGVVGETEPGWITFSGYGGHKWWIEVPVK